MYQVVKGQPAYSCSFEFEEPYPVEIESNNILRKFVNGDSSEFRFKNT